MSNTAENSLFFESPSGKRHTSREKIGEHLEPGHPVGSMEWPETGSPLEYWRIATECINRGIES